MATPEQVAELGHQISSEGLDRILQKRRGQQQQKKQQGQGEQQWQMLDEQVLRMILTRASMEEAIEWVFDNINQVNTWQAQAEAGEPLPNAADEDVAELCTSSSTSSSTSSEQMMSLPTPAHPLVLDLASAGVNAHGEVLTDDIVALIVQFMLFPHGMQASAHREPFPLRPIHHCALASRGWASVLFCDDLWSMIAHCLWPQSCTGPTVLQTYNLSVNTSPWLGLVATGNKSGAWPCAVVHNGSSVYKHARPGYWFECKVLMVRWDRLSRTVRVYFDAKGESDLRDPASSAIIVSPVAAQREKSWASQKKADASRSLTSVESQFFVSRAGHIKGYVAYNESHLFADTQNPGLMFCFANRTASGDYPPVQLPVLDPNNWEHDCWDQENPDFFFEPELSCIEAETQEEEDARWAGLPDHVRQRQNGEGARAWGASTQEGNRFANLRMRSNRWH